MPPDGLDCDLVGVEELGATAFLHRHVVGVIPPLCDCLLRFEAADAEVRAVFAAVPLDADEPGTLDTSSSICSKPC
jgi:hypothetical protein